MRRILVIVFFLLLVVDCHASNWRSQVDELLSRGFADLATVNVTQQELKKSEIEDVAAKVPTWQSLVSHLQSRAIRIGQQPQDCFNNLTGKNGFARGEEALLLNQIAGSDGIVRPWVLYVPASHSFLRPAPMLVALHGGVSRHKINENPLEHAMASPWLAAARARRCLALFPFGQEGATWWDNVGITNVRQLIRAVKSNFNVDDNRVYLAGFSDGGSAGFLYAMICSDDYAAIVALNGHMGVGSLDGKLPLYAPNMAMTPIYAVTTDKDGLYPTSKMAPTITMAKLAGASIVYRQLPGTHEFDYQAAEMPLINRFIARNARNPLPDKILWETADPATGRCRWLQISEICNEAPAPWHIDHNCIMQSEEIEWGFSAVRTTGGIEVNKIVTGGYAEDIGIRIGDVLIKAGGARITDSFSLRDAKEKARCGARFAFVVRRAGKELLLPGILPQPELYYLFARDVPSAAVKAEQVGNLVTIEGSRVARMQIFVHPDQFDLNQPIKVIYNSRCIFNSIVKPDSAFILADYAANRDRKALFVACIDLHIK